MELSQVLASKVSDSLQGKELTIENVCKLLLESKCLEEKRVRQYLAISEFFERYADQTKTQLIKDVSHKYKISESSLYYLLDEKRFNM
jgi:hypothetical protein